MTKRRKTQAQLMEETLVEGYHLHKVSDEYAYAHEHEGDAKEHDHRHTHAGYAGDHDHLLSSIPTGVEGERSELPDTHDHDPVPDCGHLGTDPGVARHIINHRGHQRILCAECAGVFDWEAFDAEIDALDTEEAKT